VEDPGADELGHGRVRATPAWPRGWLVTTAVVAGLSALLGWQLRGPGPRSRPDASDRTPPAIASPTVSRPTADEGLDLYSVPVTSVEQLPVMTELDGRVLVAAQDGALVFHDGKSPNRVTMPAAPGDPPYRLIGRGNALVFYGRDTVFVVAADPAAREHVVTKGTDFAVFVPSAHPDRIWVQEGQTDGSPRRLWEVSRSGEVTVPPAQAPAGNIVAGVESGVVLQIEGGLDVWDPVTARVLRHIEGSFPLGAAGESLAWCDGDCRAAHLTDTASGIDHIVLRLDGDAGLDGYVDGLSPDGRWFAAVACVRTGSADNTCALVVVDVPSGARTVVGRGAIAPGGARVAWDQSGDLLGVQLDGDYLGLYRPSTGSLTRTKGAVGGGVYGLALVHVGGGG
jgi:hypothetical protein